MTCKLSLAAAFHVKIANHGENKCSDFTDYVLPVNSGDSLSLIAKTSRGCIVKKDGITGWYYGKYV